MVREIIKPTSEFYSLHIPKEYLNKSIEVIVLPLFDLQESITEKRVSKTFNPKEFYGAFSSTKKEIDEFLAQSKSEWKER
ncbi:MAG: hypothetical protein WC272_08500 [Sulfurimonas sp.]|jgi:hypothetical protein